MTRDNFNKANKLYATVHDAQQDLKNIRWYMMHSKI